MLELSLYLIIAGLIFKERKSDTERKKTAASHK